MTKQEIRGCEGPRTQAAKPEKKGFKLFYHGVDREIEPESFRVKWLRNMHEISVPDDKLVLYSCHSPIHEIYSINNNSSGAEK